jgi:uroporphyrinogen-III synthase
VGKLDSLRIVVTRAAHQAEELARPLRELGAEVILAPVIEIAPPLDGHALRQAAAHADRYDWIVFTSANAVRAFAAELTHAPAELRARVAVVGAATRAVAESAGFAVRVMPSKYVAEELVASFRDEDLMGRRMVIPSAAVTRDVVAPALRQLGATVDVIEAYRNRIPADAPARVAEVFREPLPHWVTLTSSSAADNLVDLAGVAKLRRVKIATIGPVTSETVRRCGLEVAVEAVRQSVAGLVASIADVKD